MALVLYTLSLILDELDHKDISILAQVSRFFKTGIEKYISKDILKYIENRCPIVDTIFLLNIIKSHFAKELRVNNIYDMENYISCRQESEYINKVFLISSWNYDEKEAWTEYIPYRNRHEIKMSLLPDYLSENTLIHISDKLVKYIIVNSSQFKIMANNIAYTISRQSLSYIIRHTSKTDFKKIMKSKLFKINCADIYMKCKKLGIKIKPKHFNLEYLYQKSARFRHNIRI